MSELPLIIFTVLSQMAVGIVAALSFMVTPEIAKSAKVRILGIGICPLMGIALLVSFFHLGSPMGALGVMRGLGSSWLSREAVAAGIFFACTAYYSYGWVKGFSANSLKVAGAVTVLVGVALVFCSAQIYMLPAHPTWNTPYTMVKFFLTSVVFGALFSAFIAAMYGDVSSNTRRGISFILWVLTPILFLTSISDATVTVPYLVRAIGNMALPVLGCLTFWGLKTSSRTSYIIFAAVFLGEVAARTMFYIGVLGLPGF